MAWPQDALTGEFRGSWAYFEGVWRLSRQIADHRRETRGKMAGEAIFTPSAAGLDYREACIVTLAGQESRASQCYHYVFDEAGAADILFQDGRPFHRLDLASGQADVTHACPPDQYRGRYRIRTRDLWTLTWMITGPRKRMTLHTRFTRRDGKAGPGCEGQSRD